LIAVLTFIKTFFTQQNHKLVSIIDTTFWTLDPIILTVFRTAKTFLSCVARGKQHKKSTSGVYRKEDLNKEDSHLKTVLYSTRVGLVASIMYVLLICHVQY